MESFPPPKDRTCRGEQMCYYFGHWRDSSSNINMCPHSKNSAFSGWLKCNNQLFTTLSNLLKMHYPTLYTAYTKLDEKYRLFGIWSMAVLNINSPSTYYIDTKDWQNGFCIVITFGDYAGGELHFPELNITLDIQQSDLVFFQSHKLTHGNKDTIGTRHSLVLVSHNTLFNTTSFK